MSERGFKIIDNFLDKNELSEIRDLYNNTEFYNSNIEWNKNLYTQPSWPLKNEIVDVDNIQISKPFRHNQHDIPKCIKNFQEKVKQEIVDVESNIDNLWIISKFHKSKKDSSILWHDDGEWKYGITYYIHDVWDHNWGG